MTQKKVQYQALVDAVEYANKTAVIPPSLKNERELMEDDIKKYGIEKTKEVSKRLYDIDECENKIEISEELAFELISKANPKGAEKIKKTSLDYDDKILILKEGNVKRSWQDIQQKIKNPKYFLCISYDAYWDSCTHDFYIGVEGEVIKSNTELKHEIALRKSAESSEKAKKKKIRDKELAELARLKKKYKQ